MTVQNFRRTLQVEATYCPFWQGLLVVGYSKRFRSVSLRVAEKHSTVANGLLLRLDKYPRSQLDGGGSGWAATTRFLFFCGVMCSVTPNGTTLYLCILSFTLQPLFLSFSAPPRDFLRALLLYYL